MDNLTTRSAVEISGVILAGGQGRRMGGVNKGLVILQGKPLAVWALERLLPQVDELFINANDDVQAYQKLGFPVFKDEIGPYCGPLAGLHSALMQARYPLVATVPCDSPFPPPDLVARLLKALEEQKADVAIARTIKQVHPVFCLCRKSAGRHLENFLLAGGRRFMEWYASTKGVEVCFEEEEAFQNINTADELFSLNF